MGPISGAIVKNTADAAWTYVKNFFTQDKDLKKEIAALKTQLDEQQNRQAAFEHEIAGLECRPQDDSIYFAKDGSGAVFCPLCIKGPEKLFTPLTHNLNIGSYYCSLHRQNFETKELRELRLRHATRPRTWTQWRRRL